MDLITYGLAMNEINKRIASINGVKPNEKGNISIDMSNGSLLDSNLDTDDVAAESAAVGRALALKADKIDVGAVGDLNVPDCETVVAAINSLYQQIMSMEGDRIEGLGDVLAVLEMLVNIEEPEGDPL